MANVKMFDLCLMMHKFSMLLRFFMMHQHYFEPVFVFVIITFDGKIHVPCEKEIKQGPFFFFVNIQ